MLHSVEDIAIRIVIKVKFLSPFDISFGKEKDHVDPVTHLQLSVEVDLVVIAVVDETCLVADVTRIYNSPVVAKVVEIVCYSQGLANGFYALVDYLPRVG